MQTSVPSGRAGDPREGCDRGAAPESAGLDAARAAEAYGFHPPTAGGCPAARTTRVRIGTGVLDVHSRTPAPIARTGTGLGAVSGGRAPLGPGATGPSVRRASPCSHVVPVGPEPAKLVETSRTDSDLLQLAPRD